MDVDGYAAIATELGRVGLALVAGDGPEAERRVDGYTWPHRDLIRRLGGRWSGSRRVWVFGAAGPGGLAEDAGPVPFAGNSTASAAPAAWGSRHYHGHRERLRQRLAEAGPEALADYELLELLLFFSIYRRDTKPLAKALLARFGSLGAVLSAEPQRLAEGFAEAGEGGADADDLRFTQALLRTVHALMLRALKEEVAGRPIIASWTALTDYLQAAMAHDPTEQFRILFLDRKNQLLRDERQSRGTVDHTPLYPREVVRRALELQASALIMVHNHPSGDPTPSKADLEMTRQVAEALETVGITLHDHVIVGRGRQLSMKAQKLI